MQKISVRCCIAGGGPAGVMAGVLLARAGVDVVVLEKHADFFRDFRGDTIHPSTLDLIHELGCLDDFLALPHQKASSVSLRFGDQMIVMADFRGLALRCPYIAFMPQWDFLNFLAKRGARYPTFSLKLRAEATGIIEEGGRVAGLTATTPHGPLDIRADLVIAADGRGSLIREKAGLAVEDFGAPMDVLWFSLPRIQSDPDETMGRIEAGHMLVAIDRGAQWQFGYVIAKGTIEDIRRQGLATFRDGIARLAPYVADRVGALDDWDKIKLLTVQVNRLKCWYRPGLLCIGDAAHAMSPVGGVGINLAVQDAVAAANLLATPLLARQVSDADLAKVQRRREFPTRMTQLFQLAVQKRVLSRVLGTAQPIKPPFALRLIRAFPFLRRLAARLIGVGIRPEHISIDPRWREKG